MESYYIENATVTLRLKNFTVQAANEDHARLVAAETVQDIGYLDKWEVDLAPRASV